MTAGIYVETPYQLINAINVAKNYLNMDGCVLFLMEKMWQTDRKFRIISSDPFIKGIYYIQQYEYVGTIRYHLRWLKGIISGFRSSDYPYMCGYYKTKPRKMPKFSSIICNKYDSVIAKLYIEVYKRKTDVYVIEDGIGDYVSDYKKFDFGFKKIFYFSEFYEKVFNCSILQAPKISFGDIEMLNIIQSLYPKTNISKIKNCKCIYFHQPYVFEDPKKNKIVYATEKRIVYALRKKFNDCFYIKLHPRDDLSLFEGFNKLDSDIPWEAMIINQKGISDKLLVSGPSTTLVSPKITFNDEPSIIYLGEILDYWKELTDDITVEIINDFFRELKRQYSTPKKVMIPQNNNQFIRFLNSL